MQAKKYILTYQVNDYRYHRLIEIFVSADAMHNRANELLTDPREPQIFDDESYFYGVRGFTVCEEFSYVPAEVVTKFVPSPK